MLFVTSVPATIPAWTDDCWASTSAVAAFNRAVAVSTCCCEALRSLERVCYDDLRTAKMGRLVTSIATWNDCVAELILWEAFARSARECVLRATSRFAEIAFLFVFPVGTLNFSIAESCFWNAFSTSMTLESLLRAICCHICIFGHWKCAFFIGTVLWILKN